MCAIAQGVRFITNDGNHTASGFSTYPFRILGDGWEPADPAPGDLPFKGDPGVGNDVWLGCEALLMPGVTIRHGAIVAARWMVTADVPPYAVAAGNPARVVIEPFPPDVVAELLEIAW